MPRRLALGLALAAALVLAGVAAADLGDQKSSIDARIAALRDRVSAARAQEDVLQGQIDAATKDIRALESRVVDVSTRYDALRRDLYLHKVRLERLAELYRLQTERLRFLRLQYALALRRLGARLVDIYES